MTEQYKGVEQRRKPRTILSEVSYKIFGHISRVQQRQVIAGTALTVLVPANPNRIGFILSNNSATDIRIGFKPSVSSTEGLLLAANGGTYKSKIMDDGEMVIHEMYAIASVDGLLCTLVESVLQGD